MAQPKIKGRTGRIVFEHMKDWMQKAYYSLIHFLHRLALEISISVMDAEQLKVAEKYIIVGYCLNWSCFSEQEENLYWMELSMKHWREL